MQKNWVSIKGRYEKISQRFQEMDMTLLDDRFPVKILKELKGEVFPEMGRKYTELELLLTPCFYSLPRFKEPILEKIDDCQSPMERMRLLGIEFAKNNRYQEYRKTSPIRIYLE